MIQVREWAHDGKTFSAQSGNVMTHPHANLAIGASVLEEDMQSEEDRLREALASVSSKAKALDAETLQASRDRSTTLTLETGETVQNASAIFAEENIEDEDDAPLRCWCCPFLRSYQRLEEGYAGVDTMESSSPSPGPVRVEVASHADD